MEDVLLVLGISVLCLIALFARMFKTRNGAF